MIRKTLIAIFAIITTLCFAIPAAAETFTSADGIIVDGKVNLPPHGKQFFLRTVRTFFSAR